MNLLKRLLLFGSLKISMQSNVIVPANGESLPANCPTLSFKAAGSQAKQWVGTQDHKNSDAKRATQNCHLNPPFSAGMRAQSSAWFEYIYNELNLSVEISRRRTETGATNALGFSLYRRVRQGEMQEADRWGAVA